MARLEERLSILQAAQLPLSADPVVSHPTSGGGMDSADLDGAEESSALDGLSMADMSAAQRRKVIMLRGKRQRLEKERRKLMGEEE